MEFIKNDVVLVRIRNIKSKAGKDFCFLTLADPDTYENVDVVPSEDMDLTTLIEKAHYTCVLDFSRYSNVMLYPIDKK